MVSLKAFEELALKGDALNFIFAKGGGGKFTSTKTSQRLAPADILIFNAASGGKLEVSDGKGEFRFGIFSVSIESLLPLFASHEISLLHHLAESLRDSKIHPGISPLAVECQQLLLMVPTQLGLNHRGQLIRIAASLLSAEFQTIQAQRGSSPGADNHVTQVFEKLTAAELISLSVGELAARFNCSRRHLNRLFHQHFGTSVATLRMEMRLLKAVSLLRDPNAKIINVAEDSGFNHLGLFNTCFKRRFGTSPGQWRKGSLPAKNPPPARIAKPAGRPARTAEISSPQKIVAVPPVFMSIFARKITDGAIVLQELERRNLMPGTPTSAQIRGDTSE
jgi:AraC-like DNA-binding protein